LLTILSSYAAGQQNLPSLDQADRAYPWLLQFLPTGLKGIAFMNQMGYTALLTMVVIVLFSLNQNKGEDDPKGIPLTKQMFKTSPVFNIGAFTIMLILTALYAVFLN